MKKITFFVLVALSIWSCRSQNHSVSTYIDSTYTHHSTRDTIFKVAPVTISNHVNLDSVLQNLKRNGQKETIIYKKSDNGNYLKLLIKENGEMMAVCHQTEQELRAKIKEQQTIITKQTREVKEERAFLKSLIIYVVVACASICIMMIITSIVLKRK